MCKVINYNLCKRGGGLSESTSVSNAQKLCIKFNMAIKAHSLYGGVCLFAYNLKILFAY